MVMYYPLISLRVQDAIRQREVKSQLHDQKIWDAEWTEAYDSFESEQRYRAWHSEQQNYQKRRTGYSSTHSSTTGGDPKGYYAALNVPPSASKSDIQGAFRGLAMKYHPDRYTDPKDKKAAKEKFQVISNAYSVLRDSKLLCYSIMQQH
jgi:DnaJ-domain-containing protein 1